MKTSYIHRVVLWKRGWKETTWFLGWNPRTSWFFWDSINFDNLSCAQGKDWTTGKFLKTKTHLFLSTDNNHELYFWKNVAWFITNIWSFIYSRTVNESLVQHLPSESLWDSPKTACMVLSSFSDRITTLSLSRKIPPTSIKIWNLATSFFWPDSFTKLNRFRKLWKYL